MRFLQKSLIRKLAVHLVVFAALIAAVSYFFYYRGDHDLPFYFFFGVLVLFLLFFVLVYFMDVIRPMKKVLYEMQALISGKPYKRILSKRIDEIGILAHFFNKVTIGLGKVSFDIKDRERMIGELNIASQLQEDILPRKSPAVPGLQIVAKTKPATELGGDSFNFITIKGKTYIYAGDVTGHGVAAGLIMTMVHSLIDVFSEVYDNAYDILVNVNRYIKKYVKKSMFMTMVMLSWDHTAKKMTYVGAGHEHILVYRAKSGECESVLSGGVALGMVPDNKTLVSEKDLALEDGDFVVLYTDGIIEARNKDDQLYELDRLIQAVREYAPQYSAEGVNYHIAKDVSEFMRGHSQDDDMTLIVVKRDDSFIGEKDEEKETDW